MNNFLEHFVDLISSSFVNGVVVATLVWLSDKGLKEKNGKTWGILFLIGWVAATLFELLARNHIVDQQYSTVVSLVGTLIVVAIATRALPRKE